MGVARGLPSSRVGAKRRIEGRPRTAALSTLLAAALLAALPSAAAWSADGARGKALYGQCKRCHQVGGGAKHRIGPHLNDLFGRAAGSLGDYRYSGAMKAAGSGGLVWTGATLDAFIADPRAVVARSRMSFKGMKGEGDRAALLSWLRGFSGARSDLPPAEPTVTAEEYGLDPKLLAIRGDSEYGAYLAGECTTCHRPGGGEEGIPSITGWPPEEFVIALHAYKRGKKVHPAMQMIAGRLSDEEIAALAAHFHRAEDGP